MGREIEDSHFRREEFRRFEDSLKVETNLLAEWVSNKSFSEKDYVAGLELELCLVDATGNPIAMNSELLERTNSPYIVPELAQFNIEINVEPSSPRRHGLAILADRLQTTWELCNQLAAPMHAKAVAIGILPTLKDSDLVLENMTRSHRYHALNEQVLRLRRGRPVLLDIHGIESLKSEHMDVMLESGATSFQLHLQVPQSRAVQAYNIATVISAPMAALSANSPLLFGKQLWCETRIPLFEQSVATDGPIQRVHFGTRYATQDLSFIFLENVSQHPVLLPLHLDQASDQLPHLRLHHGTIWRWNRPLVGFDDDGMPHFRIEHRVMAAGTSVQDMTANMAFFCGLIVAFLEVKAFHVDRLPFLSAWSNFYDCARFGLKTQVGWIDGKKWPVNKLILDELIPIAMEGLNALQVEPFLRDRWLQTIQDRVATGHTGSEWQTHFYLQNHRDCELLVREYRSRQNSDDPVHTWGY